jgi:hypothetical protein
VEDGIGEILENGEVAGAAAVDGDLDGFGVGLGESGGGGVTEFSDGLESFQPGDFPGFHGDVTAVAGDFQAVAPWGFAGASDEGGVSAIGPAAVDGHVIFDLDVVVAAELAEASDL